MREPTICGQTTYPHGRHMNYVPCWNKECKTLCHSFTRAPVGTDSDRVALSLFSGRWEEAKNQVRWEEAVNSIDFLHSSRKAWSTISKLTGRSGCSSRLCPISAYSIASQLVKNGTHRTGGSEYTSFASKQLSDLWKIPRVTVSLNVSGQWSLLPLDA